MNIHLYLQPSMRTRDENKELQIHEKAIEMIVKEGFDGFSMQKLAKAANVSPGTLYIYYKDKEDLLLQLCTKESQIMLDATMKNFDPKMSFSEGLRVQWINRARYCMKYPNKMHFLEQIRHSPLNEKAVSLASGNFKELMTEFVMNAIKNKELVKVPVEVFWSIAYAPLYNLVNFHRTGTSIGGIKFIWTDKLMNQTLELVLKALKP